MRSRSGARIRVPVEPTPGERIDLTASCGSRDLGRRRHDRPASRRLRTALTALGIAIGIAAMVAVVGISSSSRADLIAEIDALGTDLLRVQPGQTVFGEATTLPERRTRRWSTASARSRRRRRTTSFDVTVRRNDMVDEAITGGIGVAAADVNTLDAISGQLAGGRFLDAASERLPTVVLGADAAGRARASPISPATRVCGWAANGSR